MTRFLRGLHVEVRPVNFRQIPYEAPVCQCPDPRCADRPHVHFLGGPLVVFEGDAVILLHGQPIAVWDADLLDALTLEPA